ncbi:MAG: NYN domain-containing protein, partial [Ruminococcaceae bacterium]|nr:NYN domain-containing protein [Oscillospiraceae bacterium]
LYSERVDGFCLVSSDSDFTRLATRLREAGKVVYGIGEQKTPNAFIAACDRFIYLEILETPVQDETSERDSAQTGQKQTKPQQPTRKSSFRKINREVIALIDATISDLEDENGWAYLGEVGQLLLKKQPSFDSRNFGFAKLTPMIKAIGRYEIDVREAPHSSSKHIYIRIKGSN